MAKKQQSRSVRSLLLGDGSQYTWLSLVKVVTARSKLSLAQNVVWRSLSIQEAHTVKGNDAVTERHS